jgi:hypothetical protein
MKSDYLISGANGQDLLIYKRVGKGWGICAVKHLNKPGWGQFSLPGVGVPKSIIEVNAKNEYVKEATKEEVFSLLL